MAALPASAKPGVTGQPFIFGRFASLLGQPLRFGLERLPEYPPTLARRTPVAQKRFGDGFDDPEMF